MSADHHLAPGARKTTQLRQLLASRELEFILEAHNGISARIVEEAGFKGIWASGLALSAQFGVRDNNEASWTQVVDMVEFMSDVTRIPILLDGDTGYGNFNNTRRLVRKLEQRGVAGVCIEDKLFPKTNSFIDGERQELADIDEFCGKIAAGKDSQNDDDFCVVARIEGGRGAKIFKHDGVAVGALVQPEAGQHRRAAARGQHVRRQRHGDGVSQENGGQ